MSVSPAPQVVKTTVAHMPPLLEHLSLPRCDLGVRTGVEGAGGSVTNQGCKLSCVTGGESTMISTATATSFKNNSPAPQLAELLVK